VEDENNRVSERSWVGVALRGCALAAASIVSLSPRRARQAARRARLRSAANSGQGRVFATWPASSQARRAVAIP